MYSIEKKFTFEAAHSLNGLDKDHPCSSIHGHSYKLYIKIFSDELDETGFIIDFGKLKLFQKNFIDNYFDHALIIVDKTDLEFHNSPKIYIMPIEYTNTTVEHMCKHILDLLLQFF